MLSSIEPSESRKNPVQYLKKFQYNKVVSKKKKKKKINV